MKNRRKSGSYYTPQPIADFLVKYVSENISLDSISVLEPSAGDGVFISAIFNSNLKPLIRKVVAVEKNGTELKKIKARETDRRLNAVHQDFLKFQKGNTEQFSIVLGNPPYVKGSLLAKWQAEACKMVHETAGLKERKINNIWTAFLVRCVSFTDSNGMLAFILPSEFLQVSFSEELRELIVKEFERVEIITFSQLLFQECKGQDTFILLAHRRSQKKGIFYCNIPDINFLDTKFLSLTQSVKVKGSKWTHDHLSGDDFELLEKIKLQLKTVNDISSSKAGIVTAANDYFILDKETISEYNLFKYARPIVQRGSHVNGSVELTLEQFDDKIFSSKKAFLLFLNNVSLVRRNSKLYKYLALGRRQKIHKRFKTEMRDVWYQVPNVGEPFEAFFFKRCHEYPKLIKNAANVLVTDSAYNVKIREGYDLNSMIFSFYNSLTLSYAELNGRYYGGGVLELTPNEFKNLPIPYLPIDEDKFALFSKTFKNKNSIEDICLANDAKLLQSIDADLDSELLEKIFQIRKKLFLKRIRVH